MLIKDKNVSHLKGTIAGVSSYRKMNDLCMLEIQFLFFPLLMRKNIGLKRLAGYVRFKGTVTSLK